MGEKEDGADGAGSGVDGADGTDGGVDGADGTDGGVSGGTGGEADGAADGAADSEWRKGAVDGAVMALQTAACLGVLPSLTAMPLLCLALSGVGWALLRRRPGANDALAKVA